MRFITRSFSPLGYKTPRLRSVYSEDHLFYCHSATVILSLLLLLYAAKLHQGLWKCDRVINLDRFASICCRASTQVSLNLPPAVPEEASTPFPFPACLFKHTIDLVPLLGGEKETAGKQGTLALPEEILLLSLKRAWGAWGGGSDRWGAKLFPLSRLKERIAF